MTYNELITAIKAAIGPNGKQFITGQSLQDVLVNIAEWAKDTDEATRGVLETSIEPVLNIHTEKIKENAERIVTAEEHISNAELDLHLLLTKVPQLEAEIGDKADISQIVTLTDQVQVLADNSATIDQLDNRLMGYTPINEFESFVAVTDEALQNVQGKVSEIESNGPYATTTQLGLMQIQLERYAQDTSSEGISQFRNNEFAPAIAVLAPWTAVESVDNGESDDVDIKPHVFYIFENPVTVELVVNEWQTATTMQGLEALTYGFQFETGATAPTVNLPDTWRFPEVPTIEPNFTYQVSVVNGFALITGWPNS